MKINFLWVCLLLSNIVFTQVGINTTNPQGALDVVTSNNTGIVIPRVINIESVTNGNGGLPVNGTMVYDVSRNATCFYLNDKWACLEFDTNGNPQLVDGIPPIPFSECTYVKASNTDANDSFGSIALSADGNTLVVGAVTEASSATGINSTQTDNSASNSGAVYVFSKTNGVWSQQAYIKASNTGVSDLFGERVSISTDGNTLAVTARGEDSNATGIGGDQTNNSASDSGAVYIFVRSGTTWSQQAYIKSSNSQFFDFFGGSVTLSNDGNTLAVGASGEDSNASGVNGDQTNNSMSRTGAVYLFTRTGTNWIQEAYIKASNPNADDLFSEATLSGDGLTLAVGATGEDSNATGINGDQTNNLANTSGAVYIFIKSGGVWSQQAYIKASNTGNGDRFNYVSLSDDGNTLAVGASNEDSNATGVNGDQTNNLAPTSGAAYVFTRSGTTWTQEAYIKASNTGNNDTFGAPLLVSSDGNALFIAASQEDSNATGVNGNQTTDTQDQSGAVYVFKKNAGNWTQEYYLKAPNSEEDDRFGGGIGYSNTTGTLVVSSIRESSNATGINGDQTNNSAQFSGAVFICQE